MKDAPIASWLHALSSLALSFGRPRRRLSSAPTVDFGRRRAQKYPIASFPERGLAAEFPKAPTKAPPRSPRPRASLVGKRTEASWRVLARRGRLTDRCAPCGTTKRAMCRGGTHGAPRDFGQFRRGWERKAAWAHVQNVHVANVASSLRLTQAALQHIHFLRGGEQFCTDAPLQTNASWGIKPPL
jgi:hypothetical protein